MKAKYKSDYRIINQFIRETKNADWLGHARRWWPDYLFHVTDIRNAVSILKTGLLLSREEAVKRDLMTTDNASSDIIAQTDDQWKDYVRLYFRPRTPTQFRNEGFRPANDQRLNAHCPAPVCFLFDSVSILIRSDSRFSDGNLASGKAFAFSSAADLQRIPFQSVYHDEPIPEEVDRRDITFRKNAEVIVPKRIELDSLRFVVSRSPAEYETLLHLLPPPLRRKWGPRVIFAPHSNLFFKKWTLVERVEKNSESVVFHFNPDSSTPHPFHLEFKVIDASTLKTLVTQSMRGFAATHTLKFDLRPVGSPTDYFTRLWLDGHIAYADRCQEDIPW